MPKDREHRSWLYLYQYFTLFVRIFYFICTNILLYSYEYLTLFVPIFYFICANISSNFLNFYFGNFFRYIGEKVRGLYEGQGEAYFVDGHCYRVSISLNLIYLIFLDTTCLLLVLHFYIISGTVNDIVAKSQIVCQKHFAFSSFTFQTIY